MINTKKLSAFTLVELIIVIVILAILATIAFLTFSSQSGNTRDSVRMSDISNISKGLAIQDTIAGDYPLPDDKVTLYSGATTIGYQGYVKENLQNLIKLGNGGEDPLDKSYYTYNINAQKNRYQLMGFLENKQTYGLNPFDSIIDAFAATYTNRYPFVKGDMLGVVVYLSGTTASTVYTPLQDLTSTGLDLTLTNTGYKAFLSNGANSYTGTSDSSIMLNYVSSGSATPTGGSTGCFHFPTTFPCTFPTSF